MVLRIRNTKNIKNAGTLMLAFLFNICSSQTIKLDSLFNALKTANEKDKYTLYVKICTAFQDKDIDSSIVYGNKAIEQAKKLKDPKLIAGAYLGLSFGYTTSGDYKAAHVKAFEAQRIADSIGDLLLKSKSASSIGYIYAKFNNQAEALKYYYKAGEYLDVLKDSALISALYNNIGNAYMALHKSDSALSYLGKAILIRKKLNDIRGLGYAYNNIGNVYFDMKDLKKAFDMYQKSLEIKKQLNDARGIVSSLCNLGYLQSEMGNYIVAKGYAEEAVKLANEIKTKDYLHDAYESAIEIYTKVGDYKKANEYYGLLVELNKTLFDETISSQISESQARYESVKKEKEIALLKKDQDINLMELSKQRYINYCVGAVLILLLSITIIIYRGYKQKRKANFIISKQKEIVEEKQKEVIDSIRYAKKIQDSLLAPEKYIQRNIERLKSNKNS